MRTAGLDSVGVTLGAILIESLPWRGGRAVECGGLEIVRGRCTEMQGMALIQGIWHLIARNGTTRHRRWHQVRHQVRQTALSRWRFERLS